MKANELMIGDWVCVTKDFTRSAEVNNMIIFPSDWERRWPEFASGVKSYTEVS